MIVAIRRGEGTIRRDETGGEQPWATLRKSVFRGFSEEQAKNVPRLQWCTGWIEIHDTACDLRMLCLDGGMDAPEGRARGSAARRNTLYGHRSACDNAEGGGRIQTLPPCAQYSEERHAEVDRPTEHGRPILVVNRGFIERPEVNDAT